MSRLHEYAWSRRQFLASTTALAGAMLLRAQEPGKRPAKPSADVTVLNPKNRVPLSFIIDDSTCLVNMAHFAIPQFAQTYPEKYKQDWKVMPREIPDSFVREFGEWCQTMNVRGKYSIVPYPACVGWVDRFLPGWSQAELEASIKLVRDLMMPNWDIHPEMISHTVALDLKTGRPYDNFKPEVMENWGYSVGKSSDELTAYFVKALEVLKNVGFTCDGITTPGGFGNQVLPELSQATLAACRTVNKTTIPHYFRHVITDDRSVAPRVEYANGLDGDDPQCVVSIIGCTNDWTGGWDGIREPEADKFITEDLKSGRLVEVIDNGEPACLVCHWPGLYHNGTLKGFKAFQTVVARLNQKYSAIQWLKLSDISRYWAAKELTTISVTDKTLSLKAPFAANDFTLQYACPEPKSVKLSHNGHETPLKAVAKPMALAAGTYHYEGKATIVCFDLPRGESQLVLE